MYSVKEIFYTLQGEGAQSGRASVFCRFTGCNLWSGREEDRAKAVCQFCDTDFAGTDGVNGGLFESPRDLAQAIRKQWRGAADSVATPFVVFTGGEPLLQIDGPLVDAMHDVGFEVAVETNGTILAPPGIDWICVSPKAGAALRQMDGHELKVVIPQAGLNLAVLEAMSFQNFYVQPMDGSNYEENCRLAVEFCLDRPKWRISTQVHKHLAIG